MTRISLAFAGLGLTILSVPAMAAAQSAPPAVAGAPTPFNTAPVVSDEVLSGARAKADLSLIDQTASVQNSSNVSGNTITGDFTTGIVSIASDAFAGTTGLTMFNINTGNNVAINASMNVNVAIQP